jgi:exosome complex component RRP40
MGINVNDVVVPGDVIQVPNENDKEKFILGPGLQRHMDQILVTTSGVLRKKASNVYWVDCHRKRYIPVKGETVIGVVVYKSGDFFKVDIGSSEQASLSYLSFEGVTKKNRPDVKIGDVVFAKLLQAGKGMEPELVCVDSFGKRGKLGVLQDGFIFTCSLNLIRKILNPQCTLLKLLGRKIPYDVALGMNGKIWLKTNSIKETIGIGNAILAAEHLTNEEIIPMCNDVLNTLKAMRGEP